MVPGATNIGGLCMSAYVIEMRSMCGQFLDLGDHNGARLVLAEGATRRLRRPDARCRPGDVGRTLSNP